MNGAPDATRAPRPARTVRLDVGAGTDRGLVRELNEDSFLAADPVFAVADGMGGHESGEVASRECVEALARHPALAHGSGTATAADRHGALESALREADLRIRHLTDFRAGTTVSGVLLVEEDGVPCWLVFNVGDSRTYRFNRGALVQLSVDHSEVQELVDGGHLTPAEALIYPRRHIVTRAIGAGTINQADYWLLPVEDGDRILICSDGLTNEVTDARIQQVLATLADPQDAVDALICLALEAGGRDNVTVLVIDAVSAGPPEPAATEAGSTEPAATEPSTTDRTPGKGNLGDDHA